MVQRTLIKDNRYSGHEYDPFLVAAGLSGAPVLREGIYLVTFHEHNPDFMDPIHQVELHATVDAQRRPFGGGAVSRWEPVTAGPGDKHLIIRLVAGQGRSGMFLRRVELAHPMLRRNGTVSGEQARRFFELGMLKGIDVAWWLVPMIDGLYIRDMCNPADNQVLDFWRDNGACDADPGTLDR